MFNVESSCWSTQSFFCGKNPSVTILLMRTHFCLCYISCWTIHSHGFHHTFYSLELCCDEVEAVVQVAFCRHFLQVGVAVLILVHKVVGH